MTDTFTHTQMKAMIKCHESTITKLEKQVLILQSQNQLHHGFIHHLFKNSE